MKAERVPDAPIDVEVPTPLADVPNPPAGPDRPPQEPAADAARAGQPDAGADAVAKRRVKKVLIYMSTAKTDLVDLARAAQQKLQDALRHACDQDDRQRKHEEERVEKATERRREAERSMGSSRDARHAECLATELRQADEELRKLEEAAKSAPHYGRDRMVEIHGLVHGYQTGGALEVGSSRFGHRLADRLDLSFVTTKTDLSFVPGDETMIAEWVRQTLSRPLKAGDEVDSTMLIFWGHGAGVGTTLTLPSSLRGRLKADVVPDPSLLNIGGLKDGALARQLNETMVRAAQTGRFDVLVFDSCLMAGAELAYEYRNLARYVVASQTLVETAPGGPPGLNLAEVVSAFLRESAWGPRERDPRGDLRDAATQIAELVGDGRSGAQQLTVFDVDEEHQVVPDGGPTWLRTAIQWLDEHPLEREHEDLLERIRLARQKGAALPDPKPMIVRAAQQLERDKHALGIDGLLWLFSRLLSEASFDAGERDRILVAFRNAAFRNVRQFLDLRDLASQVLQSSQNRLLQLVSLALVAELTPGVQSFVVAHRVAAPLQEKVRLSGVSVYCPWFRARSAPGDPPVFNVTIDHARYRKLDLPRITGWADFVFGPLFEATSGERALAEPPTGARRPHAPFTLDRLLARLVECLCGSACECGSTALDGGDPDGPSERRILGEGKPSGPLGEGKPSGPLVEEKPSGPLGPS